MTLHYTGHLGRGPQDIIIDHDGIGDGLAHSLLFRPLPQALGDVGLVVTTGPQALLLDGRRRGLQQDEDGIGSLAADLLCSLEIDLEEDVAVVRGIGDRGPVQVSEEFGPFEEPSAGGVRLEPRSVDEDVGVFTLAGSTVTGGP